MIHNNSNNNDNNNDNNDNVILSSLQMTKLGVRVSVSVPECLHSLTLIDWLTDWLTDWVPSHLWLLGPPSPSQSPWHYTVRGGAGDGRETFQAFQTSLWALFPLPLAPKRQHKTSKSNMSCLVPIAVIYSEYCNYFLIVFHFCLIKSLIISQVIRPESFIAGSFDLPAIKVFWFYCPRWRRENLEFLIIYWTIFLFLSVHFSFFHNRIILSSSWHWHHQSDKNGAITALTHNISVSRKLKEDTPWSKFELKIAPCSSPCSSPFHNK